MADTKIEMKVDEEIKPLKELCEKMTDIVKHEVEKGIDKVNPKELGEAIDMIKDLAEAKKYAVEALYHKQIMGAMEENADEYGETWDEDGVIRKGYRGQPRSKTSGRYMSASDGRRSRSYMPEMYYDEMIPMMGYSSNSMNGSNNGNNSNSYSQGYNRGYDDGRTEGMRSNNGNMSRMERARRGYDEVKHMSNSNDSEKQKKATRLHELMSSVIEYMESVAPNMSNEEKSVFNRDIEKMRSIVK